MSLSLRTVWTGGVIAALLATSAMAAPPAFKEQSRIYGNWVTGSSCNQIENGTFCRDVSAWENYDVKGAFEYTEASINTYRYQYDPNDGSYTFGYRFLSCPVDRKAISANSNRVTLEAVLDPNSPGCYAYGYIESWDPINDYRFEPWSYPGLMNIAGEWLDPFNYGESISNQKNSYHDGWSGTITNTVGQCKYKWGEFMRAGGFSINQRSFAFEGPGGPAWSYYSLSSCNSNSK